MGLIAIGDIHGCAETLRILIDRLAPGEDDHLIFVGDYIDRGPDSKGVIDFLLALSRRCRCTFLRGNHEAFMLEYLDYGQFDLWRVNGGMATLNSYANSRKVEIPEAHIRFVRATRLYYETPDFLFVHAGLKPHLSVEDNLRRFDADVFLWERSHLDADELAWEKTVVCGHTPQAEVVSRDRLIALDTGCVYFTNAQFGRLSAIRLPEREVVSVDYAG